MSTTTRMGQQYQCLTARSGLCDRGNGKPRRQRCSYCGNKFVVHHGMFGVFVWRGDGRYHAEDALSLHASATDAERKAGDELVVRFVDPR